jgi:hypothetical protein
MKKPYLRPQAKIVDEVSPELSNRRRSQRVSLRISVIISIQTGDDQSFEVQGFTQVVNAHGGLLESALMADTQQEITLFNPKTGKEARCRVVRVERTSSELVSMAFEFHERTAQFWPVTFPPEDWEECAP